MREMGESKKWESRSEKMERGRERERESEKRVGREVYE